MFVNDSAETYIRLPNLAVKLVYKFTSISYLTIFCRFITDNLNYPYFTSVTQCKF